MTAIWLLFLHKKGYRTCVPICPQCSATIHAGADDQCPACGYSLRRADALFGDGRVEFTRVVDAAGALTHQERRELLHFLENLERDIPPVALCIYITDDGQADEFRTHAHWILNHARIHHPSFGRREKHKAIEDAELSLRFAKEAPAEEAPAPEPAAASWLSRVANYVRDALHPNLPPPVKQEWMLILVLDVQLERACFSWGYQLDPYVNPDSINRCIVGAKFQFRERAMVAGLRRVMRSATREIAAGSRRVNAQLRRTGRAVLPSAAALGLGLCLATSPCEAAPQEAAEVAAATPPAAEAAEAAPTAVTTPALPQDEAAEEVPPAPPAEGAAPATAEATPPAAAEAPAPAAEPGSAATFADPPRWSDEDYRHLRDGEFTKAYSLLFPPAEVPRAERRFRNPGPPQESDKVVHVRYQDAYSKPSPHGLCDPQGLLSVEERRDVEHVLRELNNNGRFRIYVALYRAGQKLPPELSVHRLTTATADPRDYVALVLFPLGDSQQLDIGYQEVSPEDEERHAWLQRVRAAAAPQGHGVEALLQAVREVYAIISPLSSGFRSNAPELQEKLPYIAVEINRPPKPKKVPVKDKIKAYFTNEANHPLLYAVGVSTLVLGLLVGFFMLRRRSGHLLESVADVRLSSPYGAGVSRYVRYLEGKEAAKESRIF